MSIVRQVSHIDSLLLATTISGGFHSLESGTFSSECDVPENEEFNNHISIVHIHSKHAIGYLKGRFHSLKHLHLHNSNECSHKFATYCIVLCIAIHAFAMQCEAKEWEDEDSEFEDPFIVEGLSSSSSNSDVSIKCQSESKPYPCS